MESINDKFSKKTRYDFKKEAKRLNYMYLNEKFSSNGGTVLVGDSHIEKHNPDFFFKFGEKSGQRVYNRGIDGDTSDRMFERLRDNVINLNPRNIIIEIGTNDLGLGAPVEFTYCNVEKIINAIKNDLPEANILLESVYPVNKSVLRMSSPVGKRENEAIAELNSRLARLCDANRVLFADLTDALLDKKGRLSKEFTYDGLHLNVKGYQIVTDAILPLISL